jgi:hypothetical protein
MMINVLLHRAIIYSMGSKEWNPFVRPLWRVEGGIGHKTNISCFHHSNRMRYFRGQ